MARREHTSLVGKTFGRLTVIEHNGINKYKAHQYLCQCSCGNTKTIVAVSLSNGLTQSCGCYHKERVSKKNLHSDSVKSLNPLYSLWKQYRRNVNSKTARGFKYIGGLGLDMYQEWYDDFWSFVNDLPERPEGASGRFLVRVDKSVGYYPDNLVWHNKVRF